MITVVTPTFRRPGGLARAIRSVFAQTGAPAEGGFSIVVVDNDPAGSAAETLSQLATEAPAHITFTHAHEPRAGVANARNTAMSIVKTRRVVFLDDDQTAPPGWLDALLAFHAQTPAAATFAPVETVLPEGIDSHHAYLKAFFARTHNCADGYIDRAYGCGNTMIDLDLFTAPEPMFDTTMNETGGEDDVLFAAVARTGGRYAWCSTAPVFEHVPPTRARLDYTVMRAMSYGQGPCTYALKRSPPRYDIVAVWVLIGLGKATLHGGLYALRWLIRDPKRAFSLDRAAQGWGKVIWRKDFRIYGEAALSSSNSAELPAG
ncbi:MAG: glycosyltransferase [Pseudomonadota bacterium]